MHREDADRMEKGNYQANSFSIFHRALEGHNTGRAEEIAAGGLTVVRNNENAKTAQARGSYRAATSPGAGPWRLAGWGRSRGRTG